MVGVSPSLLSGHRTASLVLGRQPAVPPNSIFWGSKQIASTFLVLMAFVGKLILTSSAANACLGMWSDDPSDSYCTTLVHRGRLSRLMQECTG